MNSTHFYRLGDVVVSCNRPIGVQQSIPQIFMSRAGANSFHSAPIPELGRKSELKDFEREELEFNEKELSI